MSRADFNKVHLDYAAYGFESERKGHVEFIEKNGRRAAATGMGLRLHGTSGRYGNQLRLKKSYRMYFRNAYGDRKLDFRRYCQVDVERANLSRRADFLCSHRTAQVTSCQTMKARSRSSR